MTILGGIGRDLSRAVSIPATGDRSSLAAYLVWENRHTRFGGNSEIVGPPIQGQKNFRVMSWARPHPPLWRPFVGEQRRAGRVTHRSSATVTATVRSEY